MATIPTQNGVVKSEANCISPVALADAWQMKIEEGGSSCFNDSFVSPKISRFSVAAIKQQVTCCAGGFASPHAVHSQICVMKDATTVPHLASSSSPEPHP